MASIRETILIQASVDKVWSELTDPVAMAVWWAGVAEAKMTTRGREVKMDDGINVIEKIVTNDSDLRRLQYSVYDGDLHKIDQPIENHISTIDVLEVEGKTLVLYSMNVNPDYFVDLLAPQIRAGLESLKVYVDG